MSVQLEKKGTWEGNKERADLLRREVRKGRRVQERLRREEILCRDREIAPVSKTSLGHKRKRLTPRIEEKSRRLYHHLDSESFEEK